MRFHSGILLHDRVVLPHLLVVGETVGHEFAPRDAGVGCGMIAVSRVMNDTRI